jgi:biopolymer transport protein ExbB
LDLIEKSGPVFYALAFCSLIATAVIIERWIALRRSRVLPRQIIDVVEAVQPGKDLSVPLEVLPQESRRVLRRDAGGTRERGPGLGGHARRGDRRGSPGDTRDRADLFWLQTVAQASPLLGLLGTVFG